MLSLSVKHPDAENFIDAKVETGKVTGANVSIKIDDEFMHAVIDGKKYHQQFPIDSDKPMYEKDIDARALWNKIVFNAWKSAEPGVLFWDTILRESVPDCYADLGFRTVSTNPCGEIPLCPYDSWPPAGDQPVQLRRQAGSRRRLRSTSINSGGTSPQPCG